MCARAVTECALSLEQVDIPIAELYRAACLRLHDVQTLPGKPCCFSLHFLIIFVLQQLTAAGLSISFQSSNQQMHALTYTFHLDVFKLGQHPFQFRQLLFLHWKVVCGLSSNRPRHDCVARWRVPASARRVWRAQVRIHVTDPLGSAAAYKIECVYTRQQPTRTLKVKRKTERKTWDVQTYDSQDGMKEQHSWGVLFKVPVAAACRESFAS